MRKPLKLALISIIISIASCNDKEDEIVIDAPSMSCQVEFSEYSSAEENEFFKEFIDSDLQIVLNRNISSIKENVYQKYCNLSANSCIEEEDIAEISFEYNAEDEIIDVLYTYNGEVGNNIQSDFIYENGLLKTLVTTYDEGTEFVDINEMRFYYNLTNQLVKSEFWSNSQSTSELTFQGSEEYTYTSGNITSMQVKDGTGATIKDIEATYDEYTNPYKGKFQFYLADVYYDNFLTLQFIFSANNPLSIIEKDLESNATLETTINYRYNDAINLPVAMEFETLESGVAFNSKVVGSLAVLYACSQ